jgi:hypothetical protein
VRSPRRRLKPCRLTDDRCESENPSRRACMGTHASRQPDRRNLASILNIWRAATDGARLWRPRFSGTTRAAP